MQAGAKYIVSAFPKLPTDVSNYFESLVVKMVIPSEIEHDQQVTNRAISLQSQENNLESDQVQEDKTSNRFQE